jgi:MFS family permease
LRKYLLLFSRQFSEYIQSFRIFSGNARLYLFATVFVAAGMAIQNVIYNLYIIQMGFNEQLVGQVVSATALGVALSGIPAGLLHNRVDSRVRFGFSAFSMALVMAVRGLSHTPFWLIFWAAANGVASSVYFVSIFPFLTEQSSQKERPHLFGSNMAVWTGFTMVGSFLAGQLPGLWKSFLPGWADVSYLQYSLFTAAGIALIGFVPFLFSKSQPVSFKVEVKRRFLPPSESREAMLSGALVLGLTGLVIGLVNPFMNVYFKKIFMISTPLIGIIFSLSQFMGLLSALIAPLLVQRFGLTRTPIFLMWLNVFFLISMGLPIPFLGIAFSFLFSVGIERMGDVPLMNLVMVTVSPSDRGSMSGLRLITNYGAQALAGLLASVLIRQAGYLSLFAVAAGVNFLAGLMIWKSFHRRSRLAGTVL